MSIGKPEDRKGTRELLEAFKMAFSTGKYIKLILKIHNLNDDQYLQNLEHMLANEIADQVTLAKNKANKDAMINKEIADLYRSSHCFVFPAKAEG